ncbi:MAG TPA: TonB-dependent receptor [Parvularculaceae bacterium]|nr:TonB-dependent receptor [Amphiplicatus sp.]MCB9954723.1 TonB-dependent receptor [Caulobacterales bacterium]HPE29911.1 TonB-dependent receptor [Parvularculaceae bacterium]HRX39509.1 TonB-dependent receptor [Parvularculaceae bacterium]
MKIAFKALIAGFSILTPVAALAQETGDGLAEGSGRDEIIVTATKRAERVNDIPMQIDVYDDADLRNKQVQEFSDLSTSIPNLVIPDGVAGAANVAIRGISSPSRVGAVAEQPVSIFTDGVFAPSGSLDLLLFDVDRVEVIRGPQGAIWGRNTLAGAISFVSKRPSDELEAYARASYGNRDYVDVRAALSGPIAGDRVKARIAFAHDERDGYTSLVGGGTAGSIDRYGVRGSLAFEPTDNFTATLIGQYDENTFTNITPEYFTGPFAVAAGTDGFQRRVDADFTDPSRTEGYGLTLLADWNLGDVLVSSVTGYRKLKSRLKVDSDASPDFLVHELANPDAEQFSQEVRFSNDAALGGAIDWMFGAEFYERDDIVNGVSILGPSLLGVGPGEGVARDSITLDNHVRSIAGFGTLDVHLTDWLTINSGLRYSRERKTNVGSIRSTLELTGLPVIDLFSYVSPERELNDAQLSPFSGISITPSSNFLVYANWGRGNKSGGFNDIRATQVSFGAEQGDSYEVGLKSTLAEGLIELSASAFLIDYDDLQIRAFEGLVPIFINAGKATSKGFEANVSVKAGEGLRLVGAVGYLDAKFDRFFSPTGADLSGNSLPNAPDWSYNFTADYSRPVEGLGELYGYAEASYTGDHFLDFANDPDGFQDGYLLVNARLGLRLTSGFSVALWGRNLTDKDYRVDFVGDLPPALFLGSKAQVLGAPRTYGVEVEFEF